MQSMEIEGPTELEDGYYPLTFGFKCYPDLENGVGTTISTMASFWLGDGYSMEDLGCKGYNIKYIDLNSIAGENMQSLIVTPETNQQ